MPRPCLVYEIMGSVVEYGRAAGAARAFHGSTDGLDASHRAREIAESLRSRLSALEQELEGYRKDAITVHALGSVEVTDPAMWAAAYREAAAPPPSECSPRHASLDEAFACEVCNNPARRKQAAISDSEPRLSHSSGIGLPCTSEYLSAQTGFNGEEGG